MRVQFVWLHLKDLIFELKTHFLSQADKLLVSAPAQKREYVLEIFPWFFCSCCMIAGVKKPEKAHFGRSASHTLRDSNSPRHSCCANSSLARRRCGRWIKGAAAVTPSRGERADSDRRDERTAAVTSSLRCLLTAAARVGSAVAAPLRLQYSTVCMMAGSCVRRCLRFACHDVGACHCSPHLAPLLCFASSPSLAQWTRR